MKFGVMFANTGPFVEPDAAIALATAAEDAGCESIWTVEHVVVPSGYASQYPYATDGKMPGGREDFDIPDPLIWLSYIAAATEKICLGTGVMIMPQRNPLVTAKAVATLDRLSKGRMILGVGSGWLEEGFDALGVSFDEHVGHDYIESADNGQRTTVCWQYAAFDVEEVVEPGPCINTFHTVIVSDTLTLTGGSASQIVPQNCRMLYVTMHERIGTCAMRATD